MTSMDFEVELNCYEMVLIRKKKIVLQSQNFSFSYVIAVFWYIQSLENHSYWNVKKKKSFFSPSSLHLLFRNTDCNNNYVDHKGL